MARVFLTEDGTFNAASDDLEVFGAAGAEQVTIFDGVTGVEIGSSVERVDLPGDIADFTFSSFGNSLTIRDANGDVVTQVSDAGGKQVVFGDGALDAAFDASTGTFTLGGEATSTDAGAPAAITPAAGEIDTTTTSDSPGAGADAAASVMEVFEVSSVDDAAAANDNVYADALDPSDGEFPIQGVGVFDDPFAVA